MLNLVSPKKTITSFLLILASKILIAQTSGPPVLSAEGFQVYCSLSEQPIVTDFSIVDNNSEVTMTIYIQISEGYVAGEDILSLSGVHDNVTSSWNPAEAKLTLESTLTKEVNYIYLVNAIKNVVFYSSNPNPTNDKTFSITVGSANYLPSTQHFYEFVPSLSIPWSQAKTEAENKDYFGIKGYLVTILSQEEADMSGKLTTGVGWIGGSDQEEEGTWKWVTGPEAGTVFWNGLSSGSSPNYANWNSGEPNNAGNEDYAHITDPSIGFAGSWNDLPNNAQSSGPYQAKGYVVEYGGSPGDPEINISAFTKLVIPRIMSAEDSQACSGETQTLTVSASVSEINWYESETGSSVLFTGTSFSVLPSATTTFWIDLIPEYCASETRTPITAIVHQYPIIINPNLIIEQCDNDELNNGRTVFNLNAFGPLISLNSASETFEFYSDSNFSPVTLIINPTNYTNTDFEEQLYVKINTPSNCSETSSLTIKVGASLIDSDFFMEFETCETELKTLSLGIEIWGYETFNTLRNELINSDVKFSLQNIEITFYSNETDASLRQNVIKMVNQTDQYTMQTPYNQEIWARVDNVDLNTISCLGLENVAALRVNRLPKFDRIDQINIVCVNLDPVRIGVASIDDREYSYTWTKNDIEYPLNIEGEGAQILVYEGGNYEVTATTTDGTNCSKKITISLNSSEVASLTQEDLTVIDLEGDTGSVEILIANLGTGAYEFSVNDPFENFQDLPYFTNLLPGIYTLYIRDKNGCGTSQIEFSILGHMKFFSPNGDGINDSWNILGVRQNFQPNTRVYVYDRTGKLLLDLDPFGPGWDGTYNGKILPQDDYWFRVYFDNGKEREGHFSLLRLK